MLLLIDIGLTFNCTVGIIGQIHTFSYALGMITALIMTALSTWFKHKFLLLIGLLFLSISALGCGLAQNLELMIIFYSLSSIGISMTIPMITTIIGDQFPLDQRTKVIEWVIASGALSIVVAAPIISVMSDMGGWRLALLGFVLPISLASFLLSVRALPSKTHSVQSKISFKHYFSGIKEVFI